MDIIDFFRFLLDLDLKKDEFKQLKLINKIIAVLTPFIVFILSIILLLYLWDFKIYYTIIFCLLLTYIVYCAFVYTMPKYYSPITITDIIEGRIINNSFRDFKIVLRNPSNNLATMKSIIVRWKYIHGNQCSLEVPREIATYKPIKIELSVDVYDENEKTSIYILDRYIDFPEKSGNIQIEMSLCLSIKGDENWHPCSNWNLVYSVDIEDTKGRITTVIKQREWINFDRWSQEYRYLFMDDFNE